MSVKQGLTKPKKPRPDFPLTPNGCGQWSKKIKGKVHYFGTWDDPDAALRRYLAEKDAIHAGIEPAKPNGQGTVGWLVNTFLDAKEQQRKDGDLSQRTFNDLHKVCGAIVDFFGKTRAIDSLGPNDFQAMRAKFPDSWAPATVNGRIRDVSSVMKFAYDIGAIDRRINTGINFKRVSNKRQRLHKAKQHAKEFTAAEIHALLEHSPKQLKAMILLGINCGYGPADCGRLRIEQIDFKKRWLAGLREKTAVARAAWLWPETIEAIREALAVRPEPRKDEWNGLVFITTHRRPWFIDGDKSNPIQIAFTKAAKKAGCVRKGVGHYALRHTLETQGGTDQVAIDYVMGHADASMAAVYRESVADLRVKAVCQGVRKWLLAGKPKAKRTGKKGGA
mgnify:CR=1 FL=1|tara:strand:- start:59648 stop:60820 length:1173 start_codon:yes stop_codon:yes gene_type:complete